SFLIDYQFSDRPLYDREVRPRLMVEAIHELRDADVEQDVWKIEGLDRGDDCEEILVAARTAGRERVSCIVLSRGEDDQKVRKSLSVAASVPGFIGFTVGSTTFGIHWSPGGAKNDARAGCGRNRGELVKERAVGTRSLPDLVKKLTRPRAVWLMVPTAAVDNVIADLLPYLEHGDILIDGGNSYYIDDIRRANALRSKGIHYVDVGTSGGVWGLERGYCMMIGGNADVMKHLDPVLATLAPGRGDIPRTPGREKVDGTSEQGYLHCGAHGAGHFVKMVHNGIEYGVMAAYAEGVGILKAANIGKKAGAIDAE